MGTTTISTTNSASIFLNLHQTYSDRLVLFLSKLGVRSSDLDDVAQEVWLRIWRAFKDICETEFVMWMMRIARNYVVDLIRKSQTKQRYLQSLNSRWLPTPLPYQSKSHNENRSELLELIQELNCPFCETIRAQLSGESVEETANRMGICQKTVYSRRNRAKNILRETVMRQLATA